MKNSACCNTYSCKESSENYSQRFVMAAIWLLCLFAVYRLVSLTHVFSFSPTTEGVLGLGTVFIVGLAASISSCLALVGGLLLSVSASWVAAHPSVSHWRKFEPLLTFNVGRLLGYFVFGGLTGMLGKSILPSVQLTGILQVFLAAIMVLLGLSMLQLVPKKYCRIPLPAAIVKHLRSLSVSEHLFAPALLGALTYFIPCGFTQSMQLVALASGSFISGGLIMLTFALGTLPALLGISAVSSFAEGKVSRIFFTAAGTISVFFGFLSIQSGLALADINLRSIIPCCSASAFASDPNVTFDRNGQQIIAVEVHDSGYSKSDFTVQAGKPTWIYATAPNGLSGCISQMAIPAFNIQKPILKGANWVGPFTPTEDFQFMCSMGMFRATVRVKS